MTSPGTLFEAFRPTPVEDLERSALQRRMTTKFLVPLPAMAGLAHRLAPAYTILLAGQSRIASYRTLHFDTASLDFFHAHRCGRRRRQKVRIRHYDDRELSYFEIKKKGEGLSTLKLRIPRPFGHDGLSEEDAAFVRAHTQAPGRVVEQVWTLFRRVILVRRGAPERVTFDFGLRYRRGDQLTHAANAVVAEVKQPRLLRRTPIMVALRDCGCRPASFSKYCAAIVALNPGIRHNRLRPRLRAMERINND